jgi:hypothetical protein
MIDTGNHPPIKQRQFRISQALHGEVAKQIRDMLAADMIEESLSPWCSPMMIVKQELRDGGVKCRFVIDLRKLNEATVKDSFPLERMDKALEVMCGALYFQ